MITKLRGISARWLGFVLGVGVAFIVLSFRGDDLFHNVIWGIGCLIVLGFIILVRIKAKGKKGSS